MSEEGNNQRTVKWWVFLILRVLLGFVFLYAGLVKVFDPASQAETVANYKITPFDQQPYDMWLGYFLPLLEVIVGLGLVLHIMPRGSSSMAALLSLSFLCATISVWVRGLDIDCGCFGDQVVFEGYLVHVILLTLMLASSLMLVVSSHECSAR